MWLFSSLYHKLSKVVMTVLKIKGWIRKGVDIGNAFLEGDID
jgi:hypothetical protein